MNNNNNLRKKNYYSWKEGIDKTNTTKIMGNF